MPKTSMDNDWQSDLFKANDRAGYALENGVFTDVKFAFHAEKTQTILQAHKLQLAFASPVFEKMFFGVLAEQTVFPIQIDGIDSATFSVMLKYIYTDTIELKTLDSALLVYGAAKKYMLNGLKKYCVHCISTNLEVADALMAYKFASFHEEEKIKSAALKLISEHTLAVLKSPDFLKADISEILAILAQHELQASELELFNALELLASACSTHVPTNNDTKPVAAVTASMPKQSLADFRAVVKQINFLEMTAEEFSSGPAFSKLLLAEESVAIMACLIRPSNIKTRYPKNFTLKRLKKPRVLFEITADDLNGGCFVIELRADIAPKTIEKFLQLCAGENGCGFKGGTFIKEDLFYATAIDFSNGLEIFKYIDQENFTLKHSKLGTVGLRSDNGKSCVSAFYITRSAEMQYKKNIVIGYVVQGMELIQQMATSKLVRIENCDVLCVNN